MSDNKPREYELRWGGVWIGQGLDYDEKVHVIEKQAYTAALKLIEEMAGALEHYESAHYTADNGVCAWDKTATKALESYRKFKGGVNE